MIRLNYVGIVGKVNRMNSKLFIISEIQKKTIILIRFLLSINPKKGEVRKLGERVGGELASTHK